MDRIRTARLRQTQERIWSVTDDVGSGFADYEVELLGDSGNHFGNERGRIRGDEDAGVGTMGIGWSVDGRSLYVATEEGILDLAINIDQRKMFPATTFR